MPQKTRYRISAGLGDVEQADLNTIVQGFAPYQNELLDAIDNNDQAAIDSIIARKGVPDEEKTGLRTRLFNLMGKLPSINSAYRTYADKITDEANATDEELQNKIGAYQGLTKTGEPIDRGTVQRETQTLFDQYKIGGFGDQEKYKDFIDNFIAQNRRLPTLGEVKDVADTNKWRVMPDTLVNFLNDQNAKNYVQLTLAQEGRKYDEDIKRIQDILGTRAESGRKEQAYADYLKFGPEELARARGKFAGEQSANMGRFLRFRTPQIIEQLNVRGLAENEGDISSSIASLGGRLQGTLESTLRDQEAADNQMFADAAFRINQARLEMSEDALREQIGFERQKARVSQEAAFRKRETSLGEEFEKAQLVKAGQQGLAEQQSSLDFGKKTAGDELAANLAAETGKAVGQTVATKIATGAPKLPERIG